MQIALILLGLMVVNILVVVTIPSVSAIWAKLGKKAFITGFVSLALGLSIGLVGMILMCKCK